MKTDIYIKVSSDAEGIEAAIARLKATLALMRANIYRDGALVFPDTVLSGMILGYAILGLLAFALNGRMP